MHIRRFIHSAQRSSLWLHVLCILVLSLTPFLWLSDGSSIIGHDTGYAILPVEHFVDRLYSWTQRYGIGSDQSFALPGFFIHGFEALVYILAGSNHSLSQRIVFSMYMFGMGISMYVTARSLFPKRAQTFLPLFAAILYEINHFVLQAWFIAERPKFLTYIALPLLILIISTLFKKKISSIKAAIITAVLFFFLNGGGAIPLFGALIIGASVYVAISLFLSRTFAADFWMILRYAIYAIFGSIALQAYWLFPYIRFVQNSFSAEVAKSGGIEGVLAWVASISQDTSYANLLRLQGIQEWYVNPYHTYARYYLNSPIFILASFLFPLLFFYSLFMHEKKDRMIVSILSLMALIGMLFMAGTHQPFGALYAYLLTHVPGFIAFRTPFYKFAPLLWFAFSLLIGYALVLVRERYVQRRFHTLVAIICIGAVLIYHFPFFSPSFFSYGPARSTKVKIPEYVFDYGRWMSAHDHEYSRTLVYPPISQSTYVDETHWGYWSLSTVFSLLDRHAYAQISAVHTPKEKQLILNVTDLLEKKDPKWIEAATLLGIDTLVVVKDRKVQSDRMQTTTETFDYVRSNRGLELIKEFGQWEFYKIASQSAGVLALSQKIASVQTYTYADITSLLSASNNDFDGFVERDADYPNTLASVLRPLCEQCLLELPLPILPPNVLLDAPGMPLYASRKATMDKERLVSRRSADAVEFELKNAVRYLSYMRFVANSHALTPIRLLAWRDYSAVLAALSTSLDRYISETEDLESRNTLLQTTQATIALQRDELLTFMRVINDLDESGAYHQVLLSLARIDKITKQAGYFSTTPEEKKYVLTSSGGYTYSVKLKSQTSAAALDYKSATVAAFLDTTQVFNGPIMEAEEWSTLATVQLKPNFASKFLLRDQLIRPVDWKSEGRGEGSNLHFAVKLDDEIGCAQLNVGKLLPGKYEVKFVAKSPDRSVDIDTFALTATESKPLLPFWGERSRLVEGVDAKTTIQFLTQGTQDQLIKVCSLFAIHPPTIIIRDITLARISAPEMVFVATNSAYTRGENRSIQQQRGSQTHYEVQVSAGGDGILVLHERFDPGWKISDPMVKHIQVNGYANGWVLPNASETQRYWITYAGQDTFTLGWKVTLIASSSLLIGGIYVLYQNLKSHH